MRRFFLLIAVIVCAVVAVVLFFAGISFIVDARECETGFEPECDSPGETVGLVVFFIAMAPLGAAVWLWDVYKKSRTK